MGNSRMTVELPVNPFCMAERDVDVVEKLCAKYDKPLDALKWLDLSFYPFRKFGFLVDDAREGWEFNHNSTICSLELDEAG